MPKSKQAGLTLIEVLISAMILFMFLTMASQAFNQSAQSSLKAERAAKVSAAVPLLLQNIKHAIMEKRDSGPATGAGEFMGLKYQWQARLQQRKPPVTRFDPSEMEVKSYDDKFNLWQVSLKVSVGSYMRTWQYEEVSWYE